MPTPIRTHRSCTSLRPVLLGCLLLPLAACETTSTMQVSAPPPGGVVALRVQPCVDRTGTKDRDLGAEATEAFTKALSRSRDFRVDPGARYAMSCDVSGFAEGSALKRWVMPGWGATVGRVAAMIVDSDSATTLLIVQGNAAVKGGGLYTLGAESYILGTAVDDAVRQMSEWARGRAAASEKGSS